MKKTRKRKSATWVLERRYMRYSKDGHESQRPEWCPQFEIRDVRVLGLGDSGAPSSQLRYLLESQSRRMAQESPLFRMNLFRFGPSWRLRRVKR